MLSIALLLAVPQDPAPPPEPSHLGVWEHTIHGLDRPESVSIDWKGRLWVAEAGAGRVRAFDRSGEELARIETGLVEPVALADWPKGVMAVDRGARAALLVTAEGGVENAVQVGDWPVPAGGAFGLGRFWLVFEHRGELERYEEGHAPEEGWFCAVGEEDPFALPPTARPADLEVLEDGGLLVLDRGRHRLVRFDDDHELLTESGGFGFFEGLLAHPGGLDVAGGRVFVADTENHRAQVFDLERLRPREGAQLPVPPLYTFGVHALRPREGKGSLHYPADVAVADDRSWGAVCEPWDDRVQVFGRGPGAKPAKDPLRVGTGQASPHYGRRIAVSGTLMTIVQPETQEVRVFDLRRLSEERRNDPIQISSFGGLGDRLGLFRRPEGMDLRIEDLSLLVCDAGNRRLVEVRLDVDPEGEVAQDFEMARFVRSRAMDRVPLAVRRADGEVFVLQDVIGPDRVLVLDEATLEPREGLALEAGYLDRPTDLAVTPDGERVLVACAEGVRVLGRDGADLGGFGAEELDEPFGICLAPDGSVVVTDSGAHAVLRFSPEGELLARWGSRGLGRGELLRPAGVAVSGAGELYVVDHANHRGVITELDGEFVHAFGSRSYTRPANFPESYDPEDYQE